LLNLKKNLQITLEKHSKKELYFFDEARFGTHSKSGHGWFETGSRTQVNVKLGFQNFYMYSSVNPTTGEDYTFITEKVNTESINCFLEQFSKQIGKKEILLVLDGASWHKSKDLKIPTNIMLMYLPPYSPELNPVERLWHYIKSKIIRNKIYQTIAELEVCLTNFFKNLDPCTIKSVCSYGY
jgi:transposase